MEAVPWRGEVNKRGAKSPYKEVHVGKLGDLPVFHAEWLKWIPLVDDCHTRFTSDSRDKSIRRALRMSHKWLSSMAVDIGVRKDPTGNHRLR